MNRLLSAIYRFEFICAVGLGSLGDVWADRAAQRLRKLSGEPSKNIRVPYTDDQSRGH